MVKKKSKTYLKIALALWGGSLGFPVGVALMAWVGKMLGWWPASPQRLLKYVEKSSIKSSKEAQNHV